MEAEGQVDATAEVHGTQQDDVKVPLLLQEGVPMYKVSAKKKKMVTFRIDADEGCVLWESKKSGISASYFLILEKLSNRNGSPN